MSIREELLEKAANSVGHMLRRRVEATPDLPAFLYPDGADGPNTWTTLTWKQSSSIIDELAAGLLARGLQYEERVAICSNTRVEWIFMDLAIAVAAGATTTVYPNTGPDDVAYILRDSNSVLLVAENPAQVAKLEGAQLDEQLHTIVVLDPAGQELSERVISYLQLRELGRKYLADHPGVLEASIASTNRDTLSTLIYTSGTTGRPKGVRLNHMSWVYEGIATLHLQIIPGPNELQYLWLPLSHVFGKALIACQLEYGFASAVDGRIDKIVQGLGEVHPTFMCGAPRIFEKVRAAVLTGNTGLKGRISHWAFAVGYASIDDRLAGRELTGTLALKYKIADKLVFSKLKEKLGGKIRFMISGSAKLSPQVQKWFYGAGITIVEGYGATETSAIASVDVPTSPQFGTIGPVLPGIEAKIADDGELLLRGPIITPGYHNLPDKTAKALEEDGWYHTGDIGEILPSGRMRITDRKKDLFKTSGGKYVAPQKVEGAIQANIPFVSQSIAVGDGRKFVSALVVLDPALLQKWADKRGIQGSYAQLSQRPEIKASIEKWMERVNSRLERWETVKKFAILDHELTVENEGVTANMKIRRSVVAERYADVVEGMYPQED